MDRKLPGEELVSCDVCCKEVPKSAAKTPESVDYVAYFCGLECYEQWRRDSEQAAGAEAQK